MPEKDDFLENLNKPFVDFLLNIFKLHDIIEASCIGLMHVQGMPRLMKHLHKVEKSKISGATKTG